jgi:hypothetical protein
MSLVELLVAMAAAMVVFMAVMNFSGIAQRSESATASRVHRLDAQRVAMDRITRELAQALTVSIPQPGVVDLTRYAGSLADGARPSREVVRWDCSQHQECARSVRPAGGTFGASRVELEGVQNAAFATLGGDYVTVDLAVMVPGRSEPIRLHDGIALANTTSGGA